MRQRQVRVIKPGKNEVYGISIPKDVAIMSQDIYYTVKRTGSSIIFQSGCKIEYTKKEVEEYKFE